VEEGVSFGRFAVGLDRFALGIDEFAMGFASFGPFSAPFEGVLTIANCVFSKVLALLG